MERRRKNKRQVTILERKLEEKPLWEREDFESISKLTGLDRQQVYKWWWDKSRKAPLPFFFF